MAELGNHSKQQRSFFQTVPQRTRQTLMRVTDLFVPPVCLACGDRMTAHNTLCATCWRQINFITDPVCDRMGLPLPFNTGGKTISALAAKNPPAYDHARAVAHYDGQTRKLLHDFKFRDQHQAKALFARLMIEAGRQIIAEANLVVPVPLYRTRLISRRFNQAALLAEAISRQTSMAFAPTLLTRTRRTKRQVGLSTRQRKLNVKGAFSVSRSRSRSLAGQTVVLIDDVITTGATVEACSAALKEAGAVRVDVLALAMVTQTENAEN